MGMINVNLNETVAEQEARFQQQKWAILELREALKNEGWMPPHSFYLRDPDEEKPHRQVLRFWFGTGSLNIPARKEREIPREELLRMHRECGYYYDFEEKREGDSSRGSYGRLDQGLLTAVRAGFTQVERVGNTFYDIARVMAYPRRAFEHFGNAESREDYEFHTSVIAPWLPEQVLQPEPKTWEHLEPDTWVAKIQDSFRHLALLHLSADKEIDQEIQWEQDTYLIHIMELYLLHLLYRAQLPLAEQVHFQPGMHGNDGVASWGPEHLSPYGGYYPCPKWMTRIIKQGYY